MEDDDVYVKRVEKGCKKDAKCSELNISLQLSAHSQVNDTAGKDNAEQGYGGYASQR